MSQLEEIFQEISAKLSTLILLSLMEKDLNLREKITIMSNTGIKNAEIAKILGISPVHVAKEKSLSKKVTKNAKKD